MIYENNTVQYVKMQNTNYSEPLMQILDNNLMAASWNKIVKRELYNGLIFPEGLNNEDVAQNQLSKINGLLSVTSVEPQEMTLN